MKPIFFISLFLEIVFRSSLAIGNDQKDVCFKDTTSFLKNFEKMEATADEKSSFTYNGCLEIWESSKMYEPEGMGERGMNGLSRVVYGMTGHAAGSTSRMEGNELQKQYKAELENIKKDPNPMNRIRRVYELVAKTQGKDDFGASLKNLLTGKVYGSLAPDNLVDASKNGSIGVCRDMASLLQWSLIQVARHPSSTSTALSPTDFSSEFIAGEAYSQPRADFIKHTWVRVHLPEYDSLGKLKGLNTFDLDTHWYPEKFSPLPMRRSGASSDERKKVLEECKKVNSCLLERMIREEENKQGSFSKSVPSTSKGVK
ncbi:MAG: hypothetical protein ACXWRE_13930 [Pseudobdellovibrionaceae bacterium]